MGAWQEIVDYTVPSNTQSVVLDSFGTITKDDFIKIVATHTNPTGSFVSLETYPNGQTTGYTAQYLIGNGSTVVASRGGGFPLVRQLINNSTATAIAYFKLSENDRANMFSNNNLENSNNVRVEFIYSTSSGVTFPSGITSFTFNALVSGALGAGSRIQIYKLAAQKVADFTVATNSTQVDIPFPTGTFDPAIDKDSEYLLVSDVIGSTGAFDRLEFYVNDLTTAANYYSQFISASGSSASASRRNYNYLALLVDGRREVGYIHIKLSNIGAFTYQSYLQTGTGTTEPAIFNVFGSSEAENITSITKLNLVSTNSAIGAGSRFILYKLYE